MHNEFEQIQQLITSYSEKLEPSQFSFLERIYGQNFPLYEKRLQNYGLTGKKRLLDAGCGFGQWSLALSKLNQEVTAIDISPMRIQFVSDLASKLKLQNIHAQVSGLESIPFPAASFDAVFCYGVLFLTDWKKSLAELVRVLAPGGTIYVNANGLGWYKFLWESSHNRGPGYDPTLIAAKAFMNTWNYRQGLPVPGGEDIIIDSAELIFELEKLGCGSIKWGGESSLQQGSSPTAPFFRGEYAGDLGVYEIIAHKEGH